MQTYKRHTNYFKYNVCVSLIIKMNCYCGYPHWRCLIRHSSDPHIIVVIHNFYNSKSLANRPTPALQKELMSSKYIILKFNMIIRHS